MFYLLLLAWFYSSNNPEKRWIFGDGEDISRGNIRFFKDQNGNADARIVDNENHKYLSDINDVKKHLLKLKYDENAVMKAMNKVQLLMEFTFSANKIKIINSKA